MNLSCEKRNADQRFPCGACARTFNRSVVKVLALLLLSIFNDAPCHATILVLANGISVQTAETLPEALEKSRHLRSVKSEGPIIIQLPPGLFRVDKEVLVSAADSGTPGSPLVIRGDLVKRTVFSGAIKLAPSDSVSVGHDSSNAPIRFGLGGTSNAAAEVRKRGPYVGNAVSGFELFQGDRRLHLARWPSHGFAPGGDPIRSSTNDPIVLSVPQSVMASLVSSRDFWVGGFWTFDWAYESARATLDVAKARLVLGPIKAPFVPKSRPRWFAMNVATALTEPGSYVLDEEAQAVRVNPYPEDNAIERAIADHIIRIDGASNIILQDLSFEKTLDTPVVIWGSTRILVQDCFIGHSGGNGLVVAGGKEVKVSQTVITDVSETGIVINGGDRQSLERADNLIEDSLLTSFGVDDLSYAAAVKLEGVGSSIKRCKIAGGPHAAVIVSGNEHLIEENDIGDVVRDNDDAGAIYMGRDWTQRGNRIIKNYIHDIGNGRQASFVVGVYLDDMYSGTTVDDNVFVMVSRPIVVGGGRDNIVDGNLFVQSEHAAILADNRGQSTHAQLAVSNGPLRNALLAVPYENDLWKSHYPKLASILDEEPAKSVGNEAYENIAVGSLLFETPFPVGGWKISPSLNKTMTHVQEPISASEIERIVEWRNRILPSRPLNLHNWSINHTNLRFMDRVQ